MIGKHKPPEKSLLMSQTVDVIKDAAVNRTFTPPKTPVRSQTHQDDKPTTEISQPAQKAFVTSSIVVTLNTPQITLELNKTEIAQTFDPEHPEFWIKGESLWPAVGSSSAAFLMQQT